MRVWLRYAVADSAMRALTRAVRQRAREIGGIECRLWSGISPRALAEGGWPPEAMISIGRNERAEQDRDELGIPGVFIDITPYDRKRRPPPEGWPVVGPQEDAIGRLAANHLWGLGLRVFALLNQGWIGVQRPRSAAFITWLAERGAACTDLGEVSGYRPFDDSDGPGPQRVVAVLKDLPRPFGIFATSDVLAELAVDWCRQAGLRVPQDVAVLGTGDDPLHAPHANVPFSSVRLPWWNLGRRALDLLVEGRRDDARLPPVGVTVRASTNLVYTDDALVQDFVAAVRDDLQCQFGVDALVERLHVSPPTLYRRCKASLGLSPSHYLQRVRVDRALRLLRDTDESLAVIAQRCGFADQASFTRAFKRATGGTPGDWRES